MFAANQLVVILWQIKRQRNRVFLFLSAAETFAWIQTIIIEINRKIELYPKFQRVNSKIVELFSIQNQNPPFETHGTPTDRNCEYASLDKSAEGRWMWSWGKHCFFLQFRIDHLDMLTRLILNFFLSMLSFAGARRYDRIEFEKRNLQIVEHSGSTTKDTVRWPHIDRWENAQLVRNHKEWLEIDGGDQRAGTTEGCDVQDIQEILFGRAIGDDGQRIYDWLRESAESNEFGRYRTDGNAFRWTRPTIVRREQLVANGQTQHLIFSSKQKGNERE